ncbi:MAG TPA: hypothetical protein VN923_16495 [Thermoanaerobaculia bacterium]|nr:hypothetical protein [Thermoanaerobaculia bacterium]
MLYPLVFTVGAGGLQYYSVIVQERKYRSFAEERGVNSVAAARLAHTLSDAPRGERDVRLDELVRLYYGLESELKSIRPATVDQRVARDNALAALYKGNLEAASSVLRVARSAAASGKYGLRVDISSPTPAWVETDSPDHESLVLVSFRFNADHLVLADAANLSILGAYDQERRTVMHLALTRSTRGPAVYLEVANDDGSLARTAKVPFGMGWSEVSVSWRNAVGQRAGVAGVWRNGSLITATEPLHNSRKFIDYIRLGKLDPVNPANSGFIDFDDFELRRSLVYHLRPWDRSANLRQETLGDSHAR